jgi:hypothetical protein
MNLCWDGTVIGSTEEHPAGTYFYILEVEEGKLGLEPTKQSKKYKSSGTVTLIRD